MLLATTQVHALPFKRKLEKHFEALEFTFTHKIYHKCDMASVKQFYEQRSWKSLWDEKRFNKLLKNLEQLKYDGLEPEDFWLSSLNSYQGVSKRDELYLEREFISTCALLKSVNQLSYGRVANSKLNPHHKQKKKPLDDSLFINKLRLRIEDKDIAKAFEDARPSHPAYAAMRKELARLYEEAAKAESKNPIIQQHINQILVNQERIRWYLNQLPERYILVNIAAYNISLIENKEARWKSRVQVGQPYRKTPIFESAISEITINPRWAIPPTIFAEDSLPAIRKDSSYLERNRIRIFDSKWNELDKDSIDWENPGNISLVQDAGPGGALGQIAIRFPNDHAIYLHETPHSALFEKEQRAFSSGCIRVENIRELAELLLDDEEHWSREKLEENLAKGKTYGVSPPRKVPIYISYITVDSDSEGTLRYLNDVYQQDEDILKALGRK